jgi:hypothetical protein
VGFVDWVYITVTGVLWAQSQNMVASLSPFYKKIKKNVPFITPSTFKRKILKTKGKITSLSLSKVLFLFFG